MIRPCAASPFRPFRLCLPGALGVAGGLDHRVAGEQRLREEAAAAAVEGAIPPGTAGISSIEFSKLRLRS